MKTYQVAAINAFPNKYGDFSGAVMNMETSEVVRERFATYDEAKNWVKIKAWEMFGPINYASIKRRGEYRANCWKKV